MLVFVDFVVFVDIIHPLNVDICGQNGTISTFERG